ncbi:hypothetical protein STXM2123_345 [Streptomyces sp. F-3]|nr:hypothetical protein STXM2123_345 [Streptomyces sp. F-3]
MPSVVFVPPAPLVVPPAPLVLLDRPFVPVHASARLPVLRRVQGRSVVRRGRSAWCAVCPGVLSKPVPHSRDSERKRRSDHHPVR